MPDSTCKHCKRQFRYKSLGRGLCQSCWRKPEIRNQYPTLGKYDAQDWTENMSEEGLDQFVASRYATMPR